MITFLLALLQVEGQSGILPAFLRADCRVPSAHYPVVLSEVEFSMKCGTLLDFGSSISGMTVSVSSSIDGVIFNGTRNSSNIVLTYGDGGNVDGFSISELKVKSLGTHYFTVSIFQTTVDLISSSENIKKVIDSVSGAKCIHGFWTILPPIAVLLVCVITKQVTIALPFAVWFGAWLANPDWNPVTSFQRVWDTYYVEAIGNVGHAFGMCFAIFLSGLVKVLGRTGGTQGIAKMVAERVKSSRSAVLGVFAVGLMIFFDDYADCLISGYTFMPLMDQYHVSREKFAFIVDATAAPIASIAPLSSWIGFELILVKEYYTNADVWEEDEQPGEYISFLKTIPYRFYPIFMIWFMFFTLFFRYDFGPMLVAEKRVKLTGQISRTQSNISVEDKFKSQIADLRKIEPRLLNGIIPILSVIFLTLLGFILTGINKCRVLGIEHTAKNIFSKGNSFAALVWAVVIGNVVAFGMALCQKKENCRGEKVRLVSLSELFRSFFEGVGVLCEPLFGILVFAWSMNGIVKDLRMGDYMISAIGGSMEIKALPFVAFILSGLMSLFIGSSFATMTLMFPLIVPLALHVSENDQEATIAVMGTILAGSVWGDHCSPMSDTTILSSMSSGCDHNDHVATQLPYAVFVAFFSTLFGDLCVGYMGFEYPYIGIVLGIALMTVCTFFISTRVPSYNPGGSKIVESDFGKSKLSSFVITPENRMHSEMSYI